MKTIFLTVFVLFLFTGVPGHSQDRVVKGIVVDAEGFPLPGVTIRVDGTKIATVTNSKGEYEIKVGTNNSKLLVSYIGFSVQEYEVGDKSILNIMVGANSNVLKYWCCTTHTGPKGSHCDTDQETLKKNFKCLNFERQ